MHSSFNRASASSNTLPSGSVNNPQSVKVSHSPRSSSSNVLVMKSVGYSYQWLKAYYFLMFKRILLLHNNQLYYRVYIRSMIDKHFIYLTIKMSYYLSVYKWYVNYSMIFIQGEYVYFLGCRWCKCFLLFFFKMAWPGKTYVFWAGRSSAHRNS